MFTIIGGDGREYGPVSAEKIRVWMASGRANLETRVKREGTSEWKRLGEVPEFSGGEAEIPPVGDPAVFSGDAAAIAAPLIARAGKLDIGSCFERSWLLLKGHFWAFVGVTSLVFVIEMAVALFPLTKFGLILVGGVFKGGIYYYFLKTIRGGTATVADAFAGFSLAFVPLMAAGLVASTLTVAGLFLLIVPGIYLGVAYLFCYLLILDRRLSFWTALEVSRRVVTAQWWRVLGLILVGLLFILLGCALLLVGLLAALPLVEGAIVFAYEDLFSTPASAAAP